MYFRELLLDVNRTERYSILYKVVDRCEHDRTIVYFTKLLIDVNTTER